MKKALLLLPLCLAFLLSGCETQENNVVVVKKRAPVVVKKDVDVHVQKNTVIKKDVDIRR